MNRAEYLAVKNKMLIKGFQATSLADYPGNIAAIVFLPLCNFRCHYCYNKLLVMNSPELIELDEQKIIEKLSQRKNLIDGVVITGGEPTLQKELPEFIAKIKKLGLKVKLDTNGTNPGMLQQLISKGLVDFIAMDIKSPPEKYEQVTGVKPDLDAIAQSIRILLSLKPENKVDYEFRTTALPDLLEKKDFVEIGKFLKGAKKYCIQQFRSMPGMIDDAYENKKTFSLDELKQIKKEFEPFFEIVELRAD